MSGRRGDLHLCILHCLLLHAFDNIISFDLFIFNLAHFLLDISFQSFSIHPDIKRKVRSHFSHLTSILTPVFTVMHRKSNRF
jgi:hypothetical protein